MKTQVAYLVVLFFLATLLSICMFAESADTDSQEAVIYFYGFDIERITEIHEEEIEKLGCAFSANADAIESALTEVDSSDANYDRRDVRAKIEMLGKSYFVDRAGVVRQEDNHFLLDKMRFIESLTQVGTCE